jgi:CRP-like cAMP-binding protein
MTEPAPPDDDDVQRLAMRLSVGYFLRFIEILSDLANRNLVQSVILLAIMGANVGALDTDPETSRRFAGIGAVPPDELRRPISVYALAASLGLPYETVRRQVHKMIDQGLCERIGDEGVIVPARVLEGPQMLKAVERNFQNLSGLDRNLRRAKIWKR